MSRTCVLALLAGLAICTSGFLAADSEQQVARSHGLVGREVEVRVGSPPGSAVTFRGLLESADSEWLEVRSEDDRFWINRDQVLWITMQPKSDKAASGSPWHWSRQTAIQRTRSGKCSG